MPTMLPPVFSRRSVVGLAAALTWRPAPGRGGRPGGSAFAQPLKAGARRVELRSAENPHGEDLPAAFARMTKGRPCAAPPG